MKPKTVILAPEKSREAFVDAIRNNRFYATESGDVKLRYSVNGSMAPADLDLSDVYRFHVEISSFNNDESAVPISCSVISDGGRSLISLTEIGSVLDFEIHSETARYFYLRLVDREGRRTWSMPVWTGRDFDRFVEPQLTPVDMSKAVAIDLLDGGADASGAIDGNVLNVWEAKSGRASVLIDLNDIRTLSALGNYPRIVSRGETPEQRASWREEDYTSTFPTAYAIYTSIDGADYVKRAEGIFRMFGGEEIITFESCRARFVRLDIMSTSGADSIPLLFREARCSIANLTLFE